jgi:hypothetical protein
MARQPKTRRKRTETPEARERRIANLRPIKPGQVLNPLGKTGVNWRQKVQDYFAADAQDITDKSGSRKVPRVENVMASLYKNALLGREPSIEMVFETMDVTGPRKIEVAGPDGAPLSIAQVQMMSSAEKRDRAAELIARAKARTKKPDGHSGSDT